MRCPPLLARACDAGHRPRDRRHPLLSARLFSLPSREGGLFSYGVGRGNRGWRHEMLSVLSRGGGRRRRGEGEGPTVRLPRHDMPIGSATHLHSPVFPLGGVVEAAVEVAGVTLGPVLVVRVGHDARTPCVVRSRSRPRAVRSRSRSWSRWRRMHAGLRCDPRGGVEGEAPYQSMFCSFVTPATTLLSLSRHKMPHRLQAGPFQPPPSPAAADSNPRVRLYISAEAPHPVQSVHPSQRVQA